MSSSDQKRLQVVASHLGTLNLSTAEIRRLSYAISSRGRFRGRKTNKIRTVRCPEKRYADLKLDFGTVYKTRKFHQVQGAAFPHLCGRLTAQRPTWDHISNDRGDPSYMYAENLRPASHSEQSLNQTNNDNPVEGRPVGSTETWRRFRNPGRAAVELSNLVPDKNWAPSHVYDVADGKRKMHCGWEFRWPEGSVQVRNVLSSPPETPLLEGEVWRDTVLPDGAAVPSGCRVSTLGRYTNSRGHVYTPKPSRNHHYAAIGISQKNYQFHQLVAATFADLIGPQPSATHTVDHKNCDASDNRVVNLGWEDKSAQSLNQTNSDNPVEGRPVGSTERWRRFRNPGRAAVELRILVPHKRFFSCNIRRVADNCNNTQHLGWEFRWPEGSVQVRTVSSSSSEPQWRDDGDFADEEWARFETLADGRLRVTPEFRDGTLGKTFVCEI